MEVRIKLVALILAVTPVATSAGDAQAGSVATGNKSRAAEAKPAPTQGAGHQPAKQSKPTPAAPPHPRPIGTQNSDIGGPIVQAASARKPILERFRNPRADSRVPKTNAGHYCVVVTDIEAPGPAAKRPDPPLSALPTAPSAQLVIPSFCSPVGCSVQTNAGGTGKTAH